MNCSHPHILKTKTLIRDTLWMCEACDAEFIPKPQPFTLRQLNETVKNMLPKEGCSCQTSLCPICWKTECEHKPVNSLPSPQAPEEGKRKYCEACNTLDFCECEQRIECRPTTCPHCCGWGQRYSNGYDSAKTTCEACNGSGKPIHWRPADCHKPQDDEKEFRRALLDFLAKNIYAWVYESNNPGIVKEYETQKAQLEHLRSRFL